MTTEDKNELTARLLVRFCAWRWMRDRNRGLCMLRPPNDWGEWEPSPKWVGGTEREGEFLEQLTAVPPIDQRFSDWERTGAVRYKKKFQFAEYGIPRLTESLDACGMLVAAMLAKGLRVQTDAFDFKGNWIEAKIRNNADDTAGNWSGDIAAYYSSEMALAICRAADAIPS